jgi:hypothetical protein
MGAGERPDPGAELSVRLSPAAVEKLIRAAVPYDIKLDAGVFTQLVRISEPRDIRLFAGGITLRARATGSPVPLDAELEPVIRLERSAAGGYQVRVESLPVKVGWAGTFDLAGSIPVTPIEELTEFALDMPERSIPVQLKVTGILVDREGIRVDMETRYP